jgi:hypothetical protein
MESVWIGFEFSTTYVCNLFGALLDSFYMLNSSYRVSNNKERQ